MSPPYHAAMFATPRALPLPALLGCLVACIAACGDTSGDDATLASLLPVADQSVQVGQTLTVALPIDNPDGRTVTFGFEAPPLPGIEQATTIGGTSAGGQFTWTPLASHVGDHDVQFVLYDADAETRQSARITITPGARSAPVFLAPGAGGTFDLAADPCVAFDLEVRDDDSPDVLFEAIEIPEGGNLSSTSEKSATFRWCPSRAQVDQSLRWELVFSADDGDHAPSEHVFVVVLRAESKEGCPGEPPTVTITSPDKGDVVVSSSGYVVRLAITDDVGVRDAPILHWTTDAPADESNPDLSEFDTLFCDRSDTQWACTIPPLDLADDEQRVLYVVATATDNDDPSGTTCDNTADSELLRFVAAGGAAGAAVDTCGVCTASSQCASGVCVSSATGGVCLPTCGTCDRGTCGEATTVEGPVAQACGNRAAVCSTTPIGTCEADFYEPNDTLGDAADAGEGIFAGTICADDLDHFAFSVGAGTEVSVLLDGFVHDDGDLDLALLAGDGTPLVTSAGVEDTELVTWCSAENGELVAAVSGYLGSENPYELTITTAAGDCCVDDGLEPDPFLDPTLIESGDTIDGTICPDNDDHFAFEVTEESLVNIVLVFDSVVTDIDIELLDESGVVVASSETIGDEEITYLAETPGIYTLRVYGYAGDAGDYVGELTVTPT